MTQAVPQTAAEMAAVGVSRIALGVEYKGSRYRGFQRQRAGVPSIQESLETALTKVAGGHSVTLRCAGRPDALVHSTGQDLQLQPTVLPTLQAMEMVPNITNPPDNSCPRGKEMPTH